MTDDEKTQAGCGFLIIVGLLVGTVLLVALAYFIYASGHRIMYGLPG